MKTSWKRLHLKNIRFRERMLLIYIIGGIIPFIWTSLYMNDRTTSLVVDKNKKAQMEALSLIGADIREAIPIAQKISDSIYADENLRNIIQKQYYNEKERNKDCSKLSAIDGYMETYAQVIEDITIYVKNTTICYNRPFAYLGTPITYSQWYSETSAVDGEIYWNYAYDKENKKKLLQLSRAVCGMDGQILGVLVIQLRNDRTTENISNRSDNTMLLFNDREVVFTNFQVENKENFIFNRLRSFRPQKKCAQIHMGVEEYLMSYERIYPEGSENYYTLVCLQDYQELISGVTQISVKSFAIIGFGLIASILMIVLYSTAFGERLNKLRKQMHLVAIGKYDEVEAIGGNDEIAEIYQELDHMAGDIQNLTSSMVEEKVQKEKLHTRQKEVEFKMLASQINPHFLYNTLETIRMKARVNKQEEIEELVKMLAKIMRRNIQVGDQMVSLGSEIELTENYLKIQSYRFGDRIESEVLVEPEIDRGMEVMPLIIQPFVENAFVHGLEAVTENGKLTIHIFQDEKDIIIQIQDNGVGMTFYQLGSLRHVLNQSESLDQTHIGVNNVNQRLKIQYGEEYGVRIESQENHGTTVELKIPKNP